ncbi:DUF6232 family protein [Methylophilus sp. Leaf414]|jgi:hypothetical protein|uniref:DUF6232 family protein n=1 Tax=Methylophilus sp. Leaf414 TaxID=1736371 RepID=UPI0007011CE6|nr:DUF6232 family protein [Methylophilus sp. Leaf414]KQT36310.1 hypothetical protein ASG24_08640 [Methylophilus sp. Leaf414]
MAETVFFSLEGIKVSDTQFIADGQTYAIDTVTAVQHGLIEPKRTFSTICVLSGSFLMIFEDIFMFVGGFSIALGLVAWFTAQTLYAVVIHTEEGEKQALTSTNSTDVDRVIRALNTAIINRG